MCYDGTKMCCGSTKYAIFVQRWSKNSTNVLPQHISFNSVAISLDLLPNISKFPLIKEKHFSLDFNTKIANFVQV